LRVSRALPRFGDSTPPKETAGNCRKRPTRELRRRVRDVSPAAVVDPFTAFWMALGKESQGAFELAALSAANPMKRDGYWRTKANGEFSLRNIGE